MHAATDSDLATAYLFSGSVLPHMSILSHTRMGHPIRVYSYGTPIRVWDDPLTHISIFYVCFFTGLHSRLQPYS